MKLTDLPEFAVGEIRGTDYSLVLHGRLSRPELVRLGACWLRMPDGFPFYATLTELDLTTGHATLESSDELRPQLVPGASMPFVDGYWGSNEVNTILDQGHNWTPVIFAATDAYERSGPDPSFGSQRVAPDGRSWRPAAGEPLPGEQLVEGAWNHEHCLICFTSIEAGHAAFVDDRGYWCCTDCYAQHVVPGSLGFMFPNSERSDA